MLQAKSKNNKTYKNMVAVSNLYQYYWQALNSLKVPTNQVKNQNYITQLVINTINAELQYSPEVQQVTNGIKYKLEFMQMGTINNCPNLGLLINVIITVNNNGTVMVNTLTLTYESKVTPAFVPNYNYIPYGGYMHTMFNNKLVQLVNYTNYEKLWQIAFINNGRLGIFNG